jgi:hypothetical protein
LAFYNTLVTEIKKTFKISRTDQCLFRSKNYETFIVQHVDDIMELSDSSTELRSLLSERFKLKIEENPEFYLGFNIDQNDQRLHFSFQRS